MSTIDLATCPACGSEDVKVTLLGIIKGPDANKATCRNCTWVGKAFELPIVTRPRVPEDNE